MIRTMRDPVSRWLSGRGGAMGQCDELVVNRAIGVWHGAPENGPCTRDPAHTFAWHGQPLDSRLGGTAA